MSGGFDHSVCNRYEIPENSCADTGGNEYRSDSLSVSVPPGRYYIDHGRGSSRRGILIYKQGDERRCGIR